MTLKQLIDELDKLRRYAGSEALVLVRVLDDWDTLGDVRALDGRDEEPELMDVQGVVRERTGDGIHIVLEV